MSWSKKEWGDGGRSRPSRIPTHWTIPPNHQEQETTTTLNEPTEIFIKNRGRRRPDFHDKRYLQPAISAGPANAAPPASVGAASESN
ncbi:hypothetical protein EVAR_8741_1 [Eumeta japonica]|uniref:Uncharacterized protein n=1 Tax=Eumeta variegata TaxID=151549 RepID=A0A4C1XMK5_EUMVA|nr:hypothetical protein EVAR_8741_1 [Eumeta japonica]